MARLLMLGKNLRKLSNEIKYTYMVLRREGFARGGADHYTGREYELDFLGEIRSTPAFKEALAKAGADPRTGYLPYKTAMDLARRFQPWPDPTNPQKEFLRDFRIEVADRLKLTPGQERKLKVFTAVRSPLDVFHGVDGFIEFEPKPGATRFVTFDLSLNPKKEGGHKADLVITEEIPDPSEDEDGYLSRIDQIAAEVAARLG